MNCFLLVNRANIGDFSQNKKSFPGIISGVQTGCMPAGVPHDNISVCCFFFSMGNHEISIGLWGSPILHLSA